MNKKYNTIALYVIVVVIILALAVFLLFNINQYRDTLVSVITPFVIGLIIAYLLNPLLNLFERRVFKKVGAKKGKIRARRALSILATYLVVFAVISGFVIILVPQIVAGYKDITSNITGYVGAIQEWLLSLAKQSQIMTELVTKLVNYINELLNGLSDVVARLLPQITNFFSGLFSVLKNSVLGIILSVYFLISKEFFSAQAKKVIRSILAENKENKVPNEIVENNESVQDDPEEERKSRYERFFDRVSSAHKKFGGYILGKIFDSIIIGVITFIVTAIFEIPYYPLISLIIGVTNIIPFFGPFIGAIPSVIIVFLVSPIDALWLIVIILIIQQLDGNVIGPKILGDNLGLDPAWILIAITAMSSVFGFVGMVFGIPLFAVAYEIIKDKVERKLKKRNLPSTIDDYYTEYGKELQKERDHHKDNGIFSKLFALIKKAFVSTKEKIKNRKSKK